MVVLFSDALMLSVLGNGPGLLNGLSMGREAGLSFPGRFSGHRWVQGFRKYCQFNSRPSEGLLWPWQTPWIVI